MLGILKCTTLMIFLGHRSHRMKIISRPRMFSKNISTNGDNWNPGLEVAFLCGIFFAI
jgi:hypothetical protein